MLYKIGASELSGKICKKSICYESELLTGLREAVSVNALQISCPAVSHCPYVTGMPDTYLVSSCHEKTCRSFTQSLKPHSVTDNKIREKEKL